MLCSEGKCEKRNRGEFTAVCILRELLSLMNAKRSCVVSEPSWKKARTKKSNIKQKQSFIEEANCIFPAYKTNILKLIRNDENREKQAKTEDIEFLKRAFKGETVKFDTGKDKSYHERIIGGEK